MKFDEYYSQYYRRIIAFARSYVNDEMVAQDIAAESMVKLWMHLKEHPDADIHHWLFVIVKNLCLDYLKHQRIKQKTLAEVSLWRTQDLVDEALAHEFYCKALDYLVFGDFQRYGGKAANNHKYL